MSRYNSLIENLGKATIFCSNLGFGEQGAVLNKLGKAIYICPNIEKARNMKSQLDALNQDNVLIDEFSKPFTLSKFQSSESKIDLIKTIFKLCYSNSVVISTPSLLFSFLPNLESFKNQIIQLNKNSEISIETLEHQLIEIGYKKVESVTCTGEFSRRGDILDIFNVIDENPTRLDFFDISLENIYSFDFLTFEKLNQLDEIKIIPNKVAVLNQEEKNEVLKQLDSLKLENNLVFDLINLIERDEDIPLEFLYPLTKSINNFSSLDYPIIISNPIQFETIYKKL